MGRKMKTLKILFALMVMVQIVTGSIGCGLPVKPAEEVDTYSSFNLVGTWHTFNLISGNSDQGQVPGWSYTTWMLDEKGLTSDTLSVTDSVVGQGNVAVDGLDMSVNITTGSVIATNGSNISWSGKLNPSKNLISNVYTGSPKGDEGASGYMLTMALKGGSNAFSINDFIGEWDFHTLFVGDTVGQQRGWSRGSYTYRLDNDQESYVLSDSNGLDNCQLTRARGTLISEGGIISSENDEVTGLRGVLVPSKEFLVTVATEDRSDLVSCASTLIGPSMTVMVKKGDTIFKTDDLTGSWHTYSIHTGTTPDQSSGWERSVISLDETGTIDTSFTRVYANTQTNGELLSSIEDLKPTLSLSGTGELTVAGSESFKGVMTSSKDMMVATQTDDESGWKLVVFLKEEIPRFSAVIGSLFAGDWTGTYSGGDTGTWDLTVDSEGVINGTARGLMFGDLNVTGTIKSDGEVIMTGDGLLNGGALTVSYEGQADMATRTMIGTWSGEALGVLNITGDFEGDFIN